MNGLLEDEHRSWLDWWRVRLLGFVIREQFDRRLRQSRKKLYCPLLGFLLPLLPACYTLFSAVFLLVSRYD
ncbi:hypothetical protein Hanom_Chr03g00272931 [Helianthus anomalus]